MCVCVMKSIKMPTNAVDYYIIHSYNGLYAEVLKLMFLNIKDCFSISLSGNKLDTGQYVPILLVKYLSLCKHYNYISLELYVRVCRYNI